DCREAPRSEGRGEGPARGRWPWPFSLPALWTVPLVMIAWGNLHGGFLAGPLIVATAGFGHAISGPWDGARRQRLLGFAAVFALSLAAPVVNPYGLGLYRHVAELLVTSGV